nr:tyrosine kinase {catalytic domain, clone Xbtk23, subdomain VIII} [Xenopus borealis, Peptide Partial, 23 aa] [Xenopus borealis]
IKWTAPDTSSKSIRLYDVWTFGV